LYNLKSTDIVFQKFTLHPHNQRFCMSILILLNLFSFIKGSHLTLFINITTILFAIQLFRNLIYGITLLKSKLYIMMKQS